MTTNNYFFVLLFITFPFFSITTFAKCHVDDKNGLLAFKSGITSDPTGALSSWKSRTDCCTWFGIQCEPSNNRVSDSNQLSGVIPDSFSSLNKLVTIDLSDNKFTGKIPASMASLAPNLKWLQFGRNSLTGKIPSFFGKFQALEILDLSSNRLTGVVPKAFANLTNILKLKLDNNLLTDPFPTLYVKGITELDLSNNSFHLVTIPKWVTSSPIIHTLNLAKCGINIKFDDWKPINTTNYLFFDLSDNQVSGSPLWFLNQTEGLHSFRVANNKLRFDLEKLRIPLLLSELDLGHNEVFGKVTPEVVKLNNLDLSYNKLTGVIPPNNLTAETFVGNSRLCGAPLSPCS